MNRTQRVIVAAAAALLPVWAGSASAGAPPSGGTISVDYKAGDGEDASATASYISAADDALAAKGFTILNDPGHAAYAAELTMSRVEVGTGSAKVPRGSASVTPGAAGVGAGVSIPFSSGETRLVPLQRIRIEMRIRKRGEDAVIWTGAAVTVRAAGTRKGADDVVAAALSEALLRSYPAQAEDAVSIP